MSSSLKVTSSGSIYGISRAELKETLKVNKFESYRANQIFKHLYQGETFRLNSKWTNSDSFLPNPLKSFLRDTFNFEKNGLIRKISQSKDSTIKWLIGFGEGNEVESNEKKVYLN
jgi:adenine C2-methylase RlmN of 23S rRNA A2503 and tRNA A37